MNIHVLYQNPQGELFKVWMVFRFVDSDFWLLNLYHKVKIKVTQRCYSWLNIHVFYQNPQGELFKVWMIFRFVDSDLWQMNLYHKHKRDTEISVLNEYEFNMNCCYMFFKGSNFYLQITHWYDFIQAWTDVTHFFKVSLENFPQSEHLYGFINMETLKFFQERFLTTLNLYHKQGNSSKYELTLDLLTVIFDCWIFNTMSK